ncbi:MAG: hypothetical protein SynsKO_17030 [Synoicihabitans sp.]
MTILIRGLFLFGSLLTGAELVAEKPDRPNVVFLMVDDMNLYGFLHEQPGLITPNMDRLRTDAVTFPNGVCNAPSCVPSRASMFSGQYPFTTGSYLNGSGPWEKPAMDRIQTIPEQFKAGGYKVWAGGKIFHSKISPERKAASFDNQPKAGGFGPFVYPEDQLVGKWWGASAWDGPDEDFPDNVNTVEAVNFLQDEHEQPFFLMLGLWRPHSPFTAPRRFFEMYDKDALPFPPTSWTKGDMDDIPAMGQHLSSVWSKRWEETGGDDPELWRQILWGYYACTTFADYNIGRVLDALAASKHADNTMIVFVSDNGYHVGEKNHFEKSTLWSASARIPFAINLPDGTNAGTVSDATVGLIDLFPTLLDYCDLPAPRQRIEGLSMRPVLEDPTAPWNRPGITVYEREMFSVTDGRFRYILYADETEELYDLSEDPHEFTNRAEDPLLDYQKQRLKSHRPERWAPSMGGREG